MEFPYRQYDNPHHKDKMASRLSYLYDGNPIIKVYEFPLIYLAWSQYMNSRHKDKTVLIESYLYNGNFYPDKFFLIFPTISYYNEKPIPGKTVLILKQPGANQKLNSPASANNPSAVWQTAHPAKHAAPSSFFWRLDTRRKTAIRITYTLGLDTPQFKWIIWLWTTSPIDTDVMVTVCSPIRENQIAILNGSG